MSFGQMSVFFHFLYLGKCPFGKYQFCGIYFFWGNVHWVNVYWAFVLGKCPFGKCLFGESLWTSRLCDIWVSYKRSSTFATQTFGTYRLLLEHDATQDNRSSDNSYSDFGSSTFLKTPKSLCSLDICYSGHLLFKTIAIQTFAVQTLGFLFTKGLFKTYIELSWLN